MIELFLEVAKFKSELVATQDNVPDGAVAVFPSLPNRDSGIVGSLLDAIPANLALIDPIGVIRAVNTAWVSFGKANQLPENSGCIGDNYIAVCHAAATAGDVTAGEVADGLTRLLAGETERYVLEYPCHSPTQPRWFTCMAAPLPLGDGQRGAVVMHIDITQRRLAEERLSTVNQARYQFICALAHEVRSPLQAIVGFSELVERAPATALDRVHGYAHRIGEAGRHVVGIVSDVLDLTKAEAGRFEVREEDVDLAALVDFATGTLASLATQGKVMLHRRLEAAGAVSVRGDERLLRQALINVLSNAIKVSPPGAVVEVVVETGAEGESEAAIHVIDHGPGIAPELVAKAMEPFVQLRAAQEGAPGTGLGLPLARRFLQLHQGDLRLSSTPGVGTTVTLALPPARRGRAAA